MWPYGTVLHRGRDPPRREERYAKVHEGLDMFGFKDKRIEEVAADNLALISEVLSINQKVVYHDEAGHYVKEWA